VLLPSKLRDDDMCVGTAVIGSQESPGMIEIFEVLSSSVWAQEFVHGWTEFRLPLRRAAVDDVAVAVLENWGLITGYLMITR